MQNLKDILWQVKVCIQASGYYLQIEKKNPNDSNLLYTPILLQVGGPESMVFGDSAKSSDFAENHDFVQKQISDV